MTATPDQDLNVGRSIVMEMCPTLIATEQKLSSDAARTRMYLGATCALGGIMSKALGKHDAVMALRAAIAAVEAL